MVSRAGADAGQVRAIGPPARRSVTVVVGLVLLLLGTIALASAALLQASGWVGAGLVLGGASLLAVGVGLVSASAHAEHLRVRRGADGLGQDCGCRRARRDRGLSR
jgi:hypothetical protein